MSQSSDHGRSDGDSDVAAADAQGLPPAEALLAGTLALMTGHAQACCEGQRALMAKKIISHLFMLSRHPGAPPNFKAIAANLHPLWVRVLQGPEQAPQALSPADNSDPHRVLWHTTPETLQ
ncbi:hypothetical protein SAMN05216350_101424 [Polaromonas sp. YR568]|uniref:hypothetical protein n=1 Tax=Polaromonas sp. YR568 TaxID=1855301 RepID=UPI0008ED9DC4|nr:hypothetical protein [Polaromonas sp. YR568]SFU34277.1 hypothetical protein SAMN05216350_101424 [Polaromonas sp. YR568]